MNVCIRCGELFEKPLVQIEMHNFISPPYEEFHVCPYCGGGFSHTQRCIDCNEYITGRFIKTSLGWLCDECYTEGVITEEAP